MHSLHAPGSWAGSSTAQLEPGDRMELSITAEPERFRLPSFLDALGERIEVVEGPDGNPLKTDFDPAGQLLYVQAIGERLGQGWPCIWLEYQSAGRFRLQVESTPPGGSLTLAEGLTVDDDPDAWQLLVGRDRHVATIEDIQLGLRAAKLATHGGFDQLICLPLLRDMDLLEHQVRTAKTVLRRFRGRAMLCDEVGLGKTIEAGMIASELVTRGLVRSVLVITPPSLVEQWQGELRRKFSLDCTTFDDPGFRAAGAEAWTQYDRIIVSLHTAKREPHRRAIAARKWDLVIIDEAHHLRNRTTQAWKFASELQKQYILLLTATPVQNQLEELFNLVTLLEPGLLSTARRFQSRFVDRQDKLTPKNVDDLHALLSEVMVRNRRSTVGLSFTRRWARTERIALEAPERQLYDDVAAFVRHGLQKDAAAKGLNRMVLVTLQLALGSSPQAAAGMLENLAAKASARQQDGENLARLAARAVSLRGSAKTVRLLKLLGEFRDKIVVFTQFRATQEMLARTLAEAGHDVALFHGGLSRLEKERAIGQFRGPARVLLTTDAGSEGRNLQFAHNVCNFDLPWNPMKIEQRIGRLSRIGQTHEVHVFNLVAAGTVEAAVLHLLEAKLSMFELVIGEIDMILGNLDDEREFEDVVADLWAESHDGDDFNRRMEDLGNRLLAAKEAYVRQRTHDDKLFGNRFAPDA
ncbi:MAG: SNF2-related protein [Pirellulales bacterium]